jgi:anti-anti-sigma factor
MAGVTVRTSTCGGHAVVALCGELDASGAAGAAAAVTAAGDRVIVDLSALEFIDCCALAALLRVQETARLADGDVLLAAPRELVRRVLDLTGAADRLGVFASVPAAAASTGRCAVPSPAPVCGPPGKAVPRPRRSVMVSFGSGAGAGPAGRPGGRRR